MGFPNRKIATCPGCCSLSVAGTTLRDCRADFLREGKYDAETDTWISVWRCTNCNFEKPVGKRKTYRGLSKSQKHELTRLAVNYDLDKPGLQIKDYDEVAVLSVWPSDGRVWVAVRSSRHGFASSYYIGRRGKVSYEGVYYGDAQPLNPEDHTGPVGFISVDDLWEKKDA
jgi:hypothetical protein